jgi:hypothetical protein
LFQLTIAICEINLSENLKEAVIHECGHAKAYKGKTAKEIELMNNDIKDKGVEEISEIAKADGAECIAEVLLSRNSHIPQKAKELYDRCVKSNKYKISK